MKPILANPLLAFSVLLQFIAFFWSIRLAYRQRDWRFALLAIAMGVIAVRRLFIVFQSISPPGRIGELPGIVLGAVTLAAIIALDNALTERDRAIQELSQSHQQLRELAIRLDTVREEERARISREIHDEIGQVMTGLKIETRMFAKEIQDSHPHLLPHTQEMQQLVDRTMVAMRDIATELRPSVLDHLGLVAAIEWQAEAFQDRTGIECTVRSEIGDLEITGGLATAVFRIFQESLTNVLKHSEATEVDVSLSRNGDNLVMKVFDNGNGLPSKALNKPQALGVVGMRERALAFSGNIKLHNAPNGGVLVTLTIPVNHHEPLS